MTGSRPWRMAWQHRSESPLITIQTAASGADAAEPAVTVTPRSTWAASGETFQAEPNMCISHFERFVSDIFL